jgi:Protein of unknown function (DUF1761)
MPAGQPKVQQNFLAILVAAIACFLLEGVWYTVFEQAWLLGIGRTREFLMSLGVNPALQYGTAFLAAALSAAAISGVTQLTGAQTAARGAKVGAFLWFGLVLPTWATEYVFEVRSYALFAINTGVWLIGMVLMGAIVGAWKKKQKN